MGVTTPCKCVKWETMEDASSEDIDCKFQSCTILRSDSRGTGAYGSVYKARCDSLLCAAKILHSNLVFSADEARMPPEQLKQLPRMRFQQECKFLRVLRHPNIVQYLGTWQDPDTGLPVLLMELMDQNLTRFLEKADRTLPFHVQVSICHDVALALSFLHSNSISHRDLSSNNVLMIGDRRAKVGDFGMAMLFNRGDVKLTQNPGADHYMPPEAVGDNPKYNISIDCFSFGVLTLQILTLVYPKPRDMYVKVGEQNKYERVPEVQRRQSHIELVEAVHPLLKLALECLNDREGLRPSAQELCTRVEEMRESQQFSDSERESDLARENRELRGRLKTMKDEHKAEISSLKSLHSKAIKELEKQMAKELAELHKANLHKIEEQHQQHMLEISEQDKVIRALEEELKFVRHDHNHDLVKLRQEHVLQLRAVEEEREELKHKNKLMGQEVKEKEGELRRLLRARSSETSTATESEAELDSIRSPSGVGDMLAFDWALKDSTAPHPIYREDAEAVFCNSTLYLRPSSRRLVLAYDPWKDRWREVQRCPLRHSTLAHVDDMLHALGGRNDGLVYYNTVYKLIDTIDGGSGRWEETGYPMPTRRCSVIAARAKAWLVVAGGEGEGARVRRVEVMNTQTYAWSAVADLPEALVFSSATFCNGHLYLLGGEFGYNGVERNRMLTCSLDDLLGSIHAPQKHRNRRTQELPPPLVKVWHKHTGPPVTQSACISFQGRVLSLGGRGEDKKPTTAVYQCSGGAWQLVGYMVETRSKCFATVLPPAGAGGVGPGTESAKPREARQEEILVVGGHTYSGKTASLEIGTVLTLSYNIL